MIETSFWKTELLTPADDIELGHEFTRRTEKRAALLERQIMLSPASQPRGATAIGVEDTLTCFSYFRLYHANLWQKR